nr:uncharacterized protein LOC129416452 isoform X1 [Misgurnus anguillicaudatus]
MASSYMKRLYANDRFIIHQDTDCWTSELIHCVGLECILEVLHGTQVLEDLRLIKDCKPASVSNWSFDENCHFCCLRREKVKDHVVALNKQIVESGGKPLLGKDLSNISRLEWQSEEFLNAVLHRKEYTPRIPDPHIPVVACKIMQQMITRLTTFYTSKTNCSQDSLENDENKDQSLLKSISVMSTAAASQTLVNDKVIMTDQDGPLDLSMKKIKVENVEQDGVLDLSTKKNCNNGQTSLRNSYAHVSTAAHLVKRGSVDLSLARVRDVQSASTLEDFMSKLCMHHQHQIVDALGFLQSEVKTSSHSQAPAPTLSDREAITSCSRVSEIQRSERTCSVDTAGTQEQYVFRTAKKESEEVLNADVSVIAPKKPEDLCETGAGSLLPSTRRAGIECENVDSTSKSQRHFVMKKASSDPLEAKQLSDSCFQQEGTDSEKTCPYKAERRLPMCTAEADRARLSPENVDKCSPAQSRDAVLKPSTVERTSNGGFPICPRTARKSRKSSGSFLRERNGSSNYVVIDPDSHCDLVFVKKTITECQLQSHNRLHPRQNARKSTRGHKYVEEYLELKTVRTLARKSVSDASGNCLALMPDVHSSIAPRQSFSKPVSVPLVSAPFTGDCVKDVVQKLSTEQMVDNEMPGDVVKITSQGLIVETSQTGKTESHDQISHEPAGEQMELSVQQDVMMEAVSCAPYTVQTCNTDKDMPEIKTSSVESVELIVRTDECDSQIDHSPKQLICDSESKCQDESVDLPLLSSVSPNTTKDDSTNELNVEPRMADAATNNEEDESLQEQVLRENHETVNCFQVPEENQGDSGVSGVKEVTTVEKCVEKMDMEKIDVAPPMNTPKDLDAKTVLAKQAVSSDRCLRSRGSKGSVDTTKDSKCAVEHVDLKMTTHANVNSPETLLVKQPLKSIETIVHSEGEHDLKASDTLESDAKPSSSLDDHHQVKTRLNRSSSPTAVEKDEPQNLQKNSEELPSDIPPEVVPEILSITSTDKSEKPHKLNNQNSEKMPLRSQKSEIELSVNKDTCSPIKKSSPSSESMLLRSRSNTERPLRSELNNLIPAENLKKQVLVPSRNSSSTSEQATKSDVVASPSPSVMRMPLRNKSSSTIKQTKGSPVKTICQQPISLQSSESSGHMPLRSSAEQLPHNKSVAVDAPTSPGRMSLRRGSLSSTEKPCGSATLLSRTTCPQKQPKASVSSSVEHSPLKSKIKIENAEARIQDSFNLSDELLSVAGIQKNEPVLCRPPKFLEALRAKEHQQLISNLNTKFDKMHKGWVQMDKEAQPVPKPKNKADRLKEIWKSKRRIRKSRPSEQQKFSPVQMLFMKPFDLPSICRWFLQSTETQSLVIVKKVNTRLPSETQLCFHTSTAGPGSAHGIFPSLQAERLKKHLKKFAIASPVKNNPKNQRLISKALGQDISVFKSKEKTEPKTATRISTKAQSLAGVTAAQSPENLCAVTGSSKNPASARIIKKYSNMREKLQVKQIKKHKEKTFRVTRLKPSIITKKAAKRKLPTHKESKSAIVQSVKSLNKKAKTNIAVKERTLKKTLSRKSGTPPKRSQPLGKVTKAEAERVSTSEKAKVKTGTDKTPQTKASGTKVDIKKSALHRGSNSLEAQSLDTDKKPLSLEDPVLTRSQRKMESTPSQIGSPKSSTKRSLEQCVTPAKRTRTSKP